MRDVDADTFVALMDGRTIAVPLALDRAAIKPSPSASDAHPTR
jgi:hypothetical protein